MTIRRPEPDGPERYFLGVALLVPLVVATLVVTQLPATLAAAAGTGHAGDSARLVTQRPASSNPAPPPTLVAPPATATPEAPTPTAVTSPTPLSAGTYVVEPGDELKNIAAENGVSMSKIIAANNIPDADSLRVGQVLQIPGQ